MSSRDRGIELLLVRVEEADQIFDLLVRDHPADEHDVRPRVVELVRDEAVRRAVEVREVGDDRQDRGAREAERLEILAVELRVAHREVAAVGVRAELAAPVKALARERAVDAREVLGRRDVVVDERHPIGQREGGPRRARSDREVVEQQVVGMARVDELAVVARQRLEAMVGRLDEDVRLVSRRAQHPLDAEHLVADGVAVAERGEHLVDARHARLPLSRAPSPRPSAGPVGSAASTSTAGGHPSRRRSRQPGSGSIARVRRLLREAREHVEVLALDDRPVVVLAEELAAVLAERRPEPAVPLERAQRLEELPVRSRSRARRCCGCTGPSGRRTGRWRAPAGRAPTPRARPSTGSRSTTA